MKKHLLNQSVSFYFYIIICITIIWTSLYIQRWNEAKVISWDIISYYAYLPATFIDKDLSLKFVYTPAQNPESTYWPLETPNGGRVIKTTMGLAILYSPFFFIAHQYASWFNYSTSGFSQPYEMFLCLSVIFYFIIGLWFLRKLIKLYFSDTVTALVLISVVLGTNLFYYTTTEAPLSHAYSFSLIAVFLFCSVKWLKTHLIKYAIIMGITGGLIILIRPVNILFLLFPLLYGVYNIPTFLDKTKILWKLYKHIIIASILAFLIILPQLIYWKTFTGEWLFNSYIGETFYFDNPKIFKGLFGYRKGWLLYTPIMLLSLSGIYFLYKNYKDLFLPVFLFTVLNIYVVLSWWCWWYGGGYGHRAMIDSYAILALPMGAFFTYFLSKKIMYKIGLAGLTILLIVHNLFGTLQYRHGAIHWDSMTKEAYWSTFGSLELPNNWEELIQTPDYNKARDGLK